VVLITLAATAAGLSACGDDGSSEGSSPSASPTASSSASPTASASPSAKASASRTPSTTPRPIGTSIDITIKGGKVSPNGDRVKVEVGERVTLHIEADSSGELHVHSTPEQEIEFDKGTSTKQLTITQPGIVDVEDHELEQVIVQLEAR
jgi:hypothetical protein